LTGQDLEAHIDWKIAHIVPNLQTGLEVKKLRLQGFV